MQNIIDGQKVIGFSHYTMTRDVQRGKLHLVHGVGSVVRTETTLALQPGILIAEGSPRYMKELITAHKGQVMRIISAEVDCSIELMNELHIEVTIHSHELDQIKLLTDLQSLSKVTRVVPPVIDVN